MNNTHVVIMAGGIGSRFWPLSTPEYPKQFIDILGCGSSLIQLTVERFKGICPISNFWVVTNEKYIKIVKEQIPDIPTSHILAEPASRNTLPCISWACWRILQENPDANVVVTPSDAVVMNPMEFQRIISNSIRFAAKSYSIITIGVKPTRAETGYGYIQASNPTYGEICKVTAFKEKPSKPVAESYISMGNHLWNAGIFVWNNKTIIDIINKYKPNIASDMKQIINTGNVNTIFPQCEKISIDYAIMEPAAADGIVYTHPAEFGWSDLGNWQSLHEKLHSSEGHHDNQDNCFVGNVLLVECSNCIIHAENAESVVIQGLEGYIVSENNGKILICKRECEQEIKNWHN